ncbi:hypothetical protein Acr_06g0008480 [Actinidia rufa]|uniref:Reverse transcriptase Ty1/copia-type domain-containing protein n=1 Tax=Actinidia rufa TaxID=165716 RepID=A0A7J0EQY0_9ERIC|nr:hypothetical protein Acr_06g0008480 [Actinidia rufa]
MWTLLLLLLVLEVMAPLVDLEVCKHCRQRGPGHYRSNCPNNPTHRDTSPQSTTATIGVSSTTSASPPLIDVSDLPALVQSSAQTMIKNTMIPPSLPLYKHKALFPTDLSLLSSSSASPYLTNPSIELFPKDVDVPAVLPDDTLHVVPPTIVYPVESSSTDFAPLVPPPIHLPSDLLVRRSTRFGSTICDLDFSASAYDSTLFTRQSTHGIVLLILYMDDMIITENDVRGISELQNFLHRHFKMKDLGPLSYFLGLEVSSGSTRYSLTQAKYASDLLTRAGLSDCKTTSTPLEANARLTSLDGELLSDVTLYS